MLVCGMTTAIATQRIVRVFSSSSLRNSSKPNGVQTVVFRAARVRGAGYVLQRRAAPALTRRSTAAAPRLRAACAALTRRADAPPPRRAAWRRSAATASPSAARSMRTTGAPPPAPTPRGRGRASATHPCAHVVHLHRAPPPRFAARHRPGLLCTLYTARVARLHCALRPLQRRSILFQPLRKTTLTPLFSCAAFPSPWRTASTSSPSRRPLRPPGRWT